MSQDLSSPGADQSASTAVERERPRQVISDELLSNVRTFEDAWAAVQASGGEVEDWSDYGTGFTVVENKGTLEGVPFVILEWRFNQGDNGEFVSCAVLTKDNRKLIINDGSTGIRDQLLRVTERRAERTPGTPETWQVGLVVERGLRRSDYTYTAPDGSERDATTFYLG